MIVGLFSPASPRSFSTRSTATCRCTSRFTRPSPVRASSSAKQLVEAALRSLRLRRDSGSVAGVLGRQRWRRSRRVLDHWSGHRKPVRHRQLGGGRDGGVADHAHRRLAQLAGRRGDLGECRGVVARVRGALSGQRAQDRRGGVAPPTPAARGVEEVLGGRRVTGSAGPVGRCPGGGLGHRGGKGQPLGAGDLRVHAGGRRQGCQCVDGLGQRQPRSARSGPAVVVHQASRPVGGCSRSSSASGPSGMGGSPGMRGQGRGPHVEHPTGRGGPELLGQEPAVGHQSRCVVAADGIEDLVHRRGEQVELVDEQHQRGLAPGRPDGCRRTAAAGGDSRPPPRGGSRWRWPSRSRPAGCRRRGC